MWWNDGKGVFSRSNVRFEYKEDTGVAVEDFDGDGWTDIFVAEYDKYSRVWFNDGQGGFRAGNR